MVYKLTKKFSNSIFFLIFLLIFQILNSIFQIPYVALASTTDGTIDATYKYAWGGNIGWINFGVSAGNVHITDSALTGYAWSDNYGWINLAPTTSGVKNNNEGALSGYAWGANLGWIDFSGVTINSSGVFAGSASGTVSGRVSFDCANCAVKTDWRPASARPTAATTAVVGGGGLPPESYNPPGSLASPVSIFINDNAEYTASPIVTLELKAGSNTGMMAISNEPDFSNVGQEPYVSQKSWNLCEQRPTAAACPADNTFYTVYVKFYTKQWGIPSETVSASIVYVKELPKKPLIARLPEFLQPFIPEFLKPKPSEPTAPEGWRTPALPLEELLAKEAPLSLKGGFSLLDPKAIGRLVFAPLPRDFRILVQKLPQLGETFSEVGITRMTQLLKLRTAKLTLPGLTETVSLPRGVPVAELPAAIKEKLPTEIVFARTGNGLIDINVALTLTEKGKAQQKITAVSRQSLELVVKLEKPAKSVKGYVVFKSRIMNQESRIMDQNSTAMIHNSEFTIQDLTASLFFAKPAFAQIRTQPVEVEEKLVLMEFEYTDPDGDGIYTAEIQAPIIDGEYEIITVMDYEDPELGMKEIKLITVVDPEGYVYEKTDAKETRVPGAVISLYWLNPETKQYELWLAQQYQQENPQTSDITGRYSFIVPEGLYHLKVEAPGFLLYEGKPFQVTEGNGVHINIQLKTKYWWLNVADYKTIILVLLVVLLCYNFYRDRIREKLSKNENTIR